LILMGINCRLISFFLCKLINTFRRCGAAYFNRSNLNRIKHNISSAMDDLNNGPTISASE
jgi:hypothetical protein